MRRWPVIGVILAVLWLFVRGVALTPSTVLGEFLIGLVAGLPIAFVFRRMYTARIDGAALVRAIPAAVVYVVLFVKELVIANLDVAYRVLWPSMPIRPAVIRLPLRVEKDIAITTIANSITLTPGTLTMDYDEKRNALYVHAIYCDDPTDVTAPIRNWEDYALRIFDEAADPSESAPPPVVRWSDDDEIARESMGEEFPADVTTDEESDEEHEPDEEWAEDQDEPRPRTGGERDGE